MGLAAALGLLTSSGLPAAGLLTTCDLAAAGRGRGFAAVGRAGAADAFTGAAAGLLTTGLGVAAAGGFGAACGLAAATGLATTGLATGLLAAVAGLLGAAGAAFFTERMALPAAGLAGACLLYTSPSPRDYAASRMPSSA